MAITYEGRTLTKVRSEIIRLEDSTWETYLDESDMDSPIFERCLETGQIVTIT